MTFQISFHDMPTPRALLKPLVDAVRDTITFGPSILLRYVRPRDRDGVVSVQTKIGPLSLRPADTDMEALREVFVKRDYDLTPFPQMARVRKAYERLVASGVAPVIIDAGANIGAGSMWFARQFPEARIYAIEPDPRNAELCRRNCRRYANVVVMEAAIGSVSGKVAISGANNQSWGVRTERGPDATVPAVTIADILREGPTPRELFMIKIDIEGFESDLFADNVDWIASPAVIMIELHDWMLPGQYSSASFQKAMAPYRFEMLNLHSNLLFIK